MDVFLQNKLSFLNVEVNCTEPFPLVSIPCILPLSSSPKDTKQARWRSSDLIASISRSMTRRRKINENKLKDTGFASQNFRKTLHYSIQFWSETSKVVTHLSMFCLKGG